MKIKDGTHAEDIFGILKELVKVLRFFNSEVVLCEGVTFIQFCILDYIASAGRLEMSELHDLLAVEKSTTTRMVNPLVIRDLIVKSPSSRDPRNLELRLTASGKEVHDKVWQCISGYASGVLANMPDKKREDSVEAIREFIRSIHACCPGKYT